MNIITQGAAHLPLILQKALAHPVQFDLAIASLLSYSLLHRNRNETLDVHRLVQTIVRANIPAKKQSRWSQGHMSFRKHTPVMTQKDWKQRAVLTVNTACPTVGDVKQWDICEQWIPHALVCTTWIEQEHMVKPEATLLLNQSGCYLSHRARYREAEPLLERALAIRERHAGSKHFSTATSLNN